MTGGISEHMTIGINEPMPESMPGPDPEACLRPTIGVFDSGFGGLTVLRALIQRLPSARFAFIGDTARLPYGSKTRRTVARYATQSAQFLVREQGAEYLVIACNTASALALEAIQDAVPVPVLGVIEPGASAAREASCSGDVAVIATDATVQSHAYSAACQARGLRALEKACPLLVPLVEEGWTDHKVTVEVIRIYLDELSAEAAAKNLKPDTLVLGCTHYPLLRPLIEQAVASLDTRVIDSAESTADAAAQLVYGHSRAPRPIHPTHPKTADTEICCFATDSVEKFERLGSRFLGQPVGTVTLIDLGG
jgi:glutamate racemase